MVLPHGLRRTFWTYYMTSITKSIPGNSTAPLLIMLPRNWLLFVCKSTKGCVFPAQTWSRRLLMLCSYRWTKIPTRSTKPKITKLSIQPIDLFLKCKTWNSIKIFSNSMGNTRTPKQRRTNAIYQIAKKRLYLKRTYA